MCVCVFGFVGHAMPAALFALSVSSYSLTKVLSTAGGAFCAVLRCAVQCCAQDPWRLATSAGTRAGRCMLRPRSHPTPRRGWRWPCAFSLTGRGCWPGRGTPRCTRACCMTRTPKATVAGWGRCRTAGRQSIRCCQWFMGRLRHSGVRGISGLCAWWLRDLDTGCPIKRK